MGVGVGGGGCHVCTCRCVCTQTGGLIKKTVVLCFMNMNCESEFVGRWQLVWGMPSLAVTPPMLVRVYTCLHLLPQGSDGCGTVTYSSQCFFRVFVNIDFNFFNRPCCINDFPWYI